jgi:hypothetical protein
MAQSEHSRPPVANPFRPTVRRRLLLVLLIGGLIAMIGIWSAAVGYRSWIENQFDPRPPNRKHLNAPTSRRRRTWWTRCSRRPISTRTTSCSTWVRRRTDRDHRRAAGCRGVGFEYDPKIAELARANAEKSGVADLVTIEQRDIFTIEPAELNRASVITLYLLPWMNEKLQPTLARLEPGKVILSHDWDLPGIKPDRIERLDSQFDDSRVEHRVYVWTTPLKHVEKK